MAMGKDIICGKLDDRSFLYSFSSLTAFRHLSKMSRTDSRLIGLDCAIPCRNEDEEIYNFAVEGFSRFDLEIGRKSTSLQAVTVLTGINKFLLLFLVTFFT